MTREEVLEAIREAKRTGAQTLVLMDEGVEEIPPEIGELKELKHLDLDGNGLESLPKEIGDLKSLEILDLTNNRLSSLPGEIGQLTNLEHLLLSGNQLSSLPGEIGQLTSLDHLDLSGNQLSSLPGEIGQLTKLEYLQLDHNRLTSVPGEIGQLTNLHTLRLENNPLTSPPMEIAEQGIEAIRSWFEGRKKLAREEWLSKMLLVGEAGVGKTSLLKLLRGLDFDEKEETTHGVEVHRIERGHPERDGVTMGLNCWDFGGQQILHSTHQFFLTNRSLFLLLWSARTGWEQGKVYKWLDIIRARAPESPVLIVATHIDEGWPADLPLEEIRKEYPQARLQVFPISCKEGTGMKELEEAIAREAAGLPLMGAEWPAAWLDVAEVLRTREKKDKTITPSDLEQTMEQKGVRKEDYGVLSRYLHDLGDILHFNDRDDAVLRDTVILDAEWVASSISHMLADEKIEKGLGIFKRNHMKKVWPKVSGDHRDLFLCLMERFDLSFRTLEDDEISIVVERLGQDPPKGCFEEWERRDGAPEITMKFDLNSSMPPGIPTWFIARSHRHTTKRHWRYGAVLKDGGDEAKDAAHLALVRAFDHDRYVTLSVRGPEPINFFAQLRAGLELTLKRYPGLRDRIERKIPCPGENGEKCGYEFDYRLLKKRLGAKKFETECQECFKKTDVRELIYGLELETMGPVRKKVRIIETEYFGTDGDGATAEQVEVLLANQEKMLAQHEDQAIQMGELLEHIQRSFLRMWEGHVGLEQSKLDAVIPRVFTLAPKEGGTWAKWAPSFGAGWKMIREKLSGRTLVLRLHCEAPGCWHRLPDGLGEYEIAQPAKWLERMGPFMKAMAETLKHTAPIVAAGAAFVVAGPAGGIASTATAKMAATWLDELKFTQALAKALPGGGGLAEEGKWTRSMGDVGEMDYARGDWLSGLRELLKAKDPEGTGHGLSRVVTKEGSVFWVCETHYEELRIGN